MDDGGKVRSLVNWFRRVLEVATAAKFAAPFFIKLASDFVEIDVIQSAAFSVRAATTSVGWTEIKGRSRLTPCGMIKKKCLRIMKHSRQ